MTTADKIRQIYQLLLDAFGDQKWWPGESRFEVIVGAVLTQNTNWKNVEKAIENLKKAGVFDIGALHKMQISYLAELIRPAGYYNIKAKRLKNLIDFIYQRYDGDIEDMLNQGTESLRQELLEVNGIGRETADSILLYALDKPVFVVDAYTFRILYRHNIIDADCDYEMVRELFQSSLDGDIRLYNQLHALIVQTGKNFCKAKPACNGCPLDCMPKISELVDF